MAIEKGTYIKLNYTGAVNGVAFDTTDAETAKKANIFREQTAYGPAIVKVGAGHVLPGVDDDLAGKEIGKEYKLTLPPEKAFGPHKSEEVKAVDKKAFQNKPEVLDEVTLDGRKGMVVNKIGNRYLVDFNHPLAGQTVEYTYTIEGVVEDGCEKLAGTIKLFTGREMKVAATKTAVTIEVPAMIAMYNQNWFMTQYMINQEAFEIFPDVKTVKFCESFPRPKAQEEAQAAPAEEKTE
ncbi:MAG TPA: FKBP-type peptidyl-prolyl cis-trans isomerase [Methanocorpusculum sp.]|nr:FKBP-type peptidyl-prolyl cis-trans isomerase [Methanocorpusculum sp.]